MQAIKLNIIPDGIYPRVCVNQYDIGRQFQILFYEDISRYYMPNGITFKINGRKADNHVFEYTESDKYDDSHYVITKSGSGTSFSIVISTTEQMTAAAGDAEVQLTLKDSANRVIGTLNFILAVQERPASVGDPSESDLPDIVRSVNGIGPDADGDVGLKWSDMSSVSNLAITEETRTMTAQRVAGSYVFVKADDQLYEVTTTINASETLTPGTNATARSVGYVLAQLNSDLASKTPTIYSKQISGETIDETWGVLYKKEFDITVDKDWRNKDVFVSFVPLASAPTTLWCAITAMTSTKISIMLIRPTSTSQVAGKIFVHCYEAS